MYTSKHNLTEFKCDNMLSSTIIFNYKYNESFMFTS